MTTKIEFKQNNSLREYHGKGRNFKGSIFLVTLLATVLFASLISPQVSLFGRGLRFSILIFFLLSSAILAFRPTSFRYLNGHIISIWAGLLYVVTGTIRYIIDPLSTLFQNLVTSGAVCVILWVVMLILRKGFPEAVETIRWLTLIVLGVSLGIGLPLLIEQPGIARLTMINPVYAEKFYSRGVANYSWYTPVAITFPMIVNWLYINKRRLIPKVIGWSCLLAASAATLFSTFTMAIGLLIWGALSWLILVILMAKRKKSRLIAIILIVISLISFPTLFYWGSEFEATQFAVSKTTSMIEGISSQGMVEGDMTGRARMFVDTIDTFLRNPIFGLWGIETNFFIGGHSSWADILGSQGLFGLFLWLIFLSPSFRRGNELLSIENGIAGGTISWILLAVGGILNPTLFNPIGYILLWLFDDISLWRQN